MDYQPQLKEKIHWLLMDKTGKTTWDDIAEQIVILTEQYYRDAGWTSPEDSKAVFMVGFDEFIREQGRRKDDS